MDESSHGSASESFAKEEIGWNQIQEPEENWSHSPPRRRQEREGRVRGPSHVVGDLSSQVTWSSDDII